MSHFAKINNNIVTEVIVAEKDFITYDKAKDAFIAPKPFASWTLNAEFIWQSPIVKPNDNKSYTWNEDTTNWVEIV